MKNKPRGRIFILFLVMFAMMGGLIFKLGDLTLAHGEEYAAKAQSRRTATTYTTGARGRILDRNGIPLAYDETSYDVQFWRDPERTSTNDSALYTESLMKAIALIEAGGGAIIDKSYIQMNEETGEVYYDWGVESETAIKARYRNYCNNMSFSIVDKDEKEKPMDEWIKADAAYLKSREMWKIPEDMPFEDADKIMSVRQEINMNRWRAYEPVTIAYNVSIEVVAQLDMRAEELLGVKTMQSTSRVYPWGSTAAHILGYLGRQVSDEVTISGMNAMGYTAEDLDAFEKLYAFGADGAKRYDGDGNPYSIYRTNEDGGYALDENGNRQVRMTRMGYSNNDYIGVAGVERTMEKYLTPNVTGRRGTETIEINKHLTVTRTLDSTAPTDGNDVMLSIDLPLQQVTEKALQTAIEKIRAYEEGLLTEKYDYYVNQRRREIESIKKAETGAIVVLDANTGKLLSMASYPSFDPNRFIAGISETDMEELFGENSNQPTLNRAIASRLAPGSIFKMATGLAGYMEGAITLDEEISDTYKFYTDFISGDTITEKDAPRCWSGSYPKHMHENNLSAALTRSCNYYFFTVADRIGIEKLNHWATQLGLGSKTGVELPGELSGHIGGQKVLYDNENSYYEQKASLPSYIWRKIRSYLVTILEERGTSEIEMEQVEACAERILKLQNGSVGQEFGEGIREALRDELGIPINASKATNWVSNINSMLTELQWKPVMTIRTGMGQGITLTTPIAAARYAATFANSGTVYDVHLVDRVIDPHGKTVLSVEPTVLNKIDAPEEFWQAVHKGLSGVVSPEDGGTAESSFSTEFVAEGYLTKIIGKSGTAQISAAQSNIDIENTSWFVAMAPKEDPEIVIITCIPHGFSGSRGGAPAVEEIIRFYMDRKENAANDNLVWANDLVP